MSGVLDLQAAPAARRCARCGTELSSLALACPACAMLVHGGRLQQLADLATVAQRDGRIEEARTLWADALTLLPTHSEQYAAISTRLTALPPPAQEPVRPAGAGRFGGVAGAAATVIVLLVTKFKFLLLGLTKISTLFSMFGFIAVYWSLHGWPLAAGLAGSIYIHEMGHVAMLRRYGIAASAPLFIPGIGAMVMLRQPVTDPKIDARIGLAGPVWGLSAGLAALGLFLFTAAPIWKAIAELTGFLNLFNLTPVWQLDGARGFHALSTVERWVVTAVIVAALWATGVGMLWIVGGVAVYQAFRQPAGPGDRSTVTTFCALVLALSWLSRNVHQ